MIDERTRHEMYLGLEEKLGTLVADAVMQHLPPIGWADVATKHDLAGLEERMELRFAGLDERMELRFHVVDLGFATLEARMTGAIEAAQRRMIQWTVGTMIALTTAFTAVGAITQLH
ncbi:MAG: hypothetical protein ABIP21_11210 [Acidimicrobiia bacterium]